MNKAITLDEPVVIVGTSSIAEIAYEYLTYDSKYEVVAFSVEKKYIGNDKLFNLPVVPFEEVEKKYEPNKYKMFIAVGYKQLNKLRRRLFDEAKKKGYELISYISSNSFVWRNVELGENCFVFEDNTIQPFVKIGDNVTLWSGNHIGHHSFIEENCFISSHVVVSGFCRVGRNSFLGVNCCLAHRVTIGKNNIIGMGSVINRDTRDDGVYIGNPGKLLHRNSKDTL